MAQREYIRKTVWLQGLNDTQTLADYWKKHFHEADLLELWEENKPFEVDFGDRIERPMFNGYVLGRSKLNLAYYIDRLVLKEKIPNSLKCVHCKYFRLCRRVWRIAAFNEWCISTKHYFEEGEDAFKG